MRRMQDWRRAGRGVIAGVLMLAMAACAAPALPAAQPLALPQPDVTPTPMLGEFHAEVVHQRALWRDENMQNYRIRFEYLEDATSAVKSYREVYVNNGSVRDAQCPIGACPITIFKDVKTISEVFTLLMRIPEECIVQVKYNRHLHYPEWVSADCADGVSQPFTLRIRDVLQMQ